MPLETSHSHQAQKAAHVSLDYRVRRVSAADFHAAMASRKWSEKRTAMAFQSLVLGHRTKDIAGELGVTKWNVYQAATTALGIVEAWCGRQVVRVAYERGGVDGLITDIESLAVRVSALEAVMERGPVCIALRKSVESLRAAADVLHPHSETTQ